MSPEYQAENLISTESRINRNLFWVTAIISAVAMSMMTIGFLTRGAFPSDKMSMFYLGVVIVYSFHKELLRWLGEDKIERQGEYFVYSWIGLTTSFYIIDFLTRGYFSHSPAGESVEILRESASLTVEVLIIFFLTRGLKILKVIWEAQRR